MPRHVECRNLSRDFEMTVENIEIGGLAPDVGGATPGVVMNGDGTSHRDADLPCPTHN